jgi:hypothetical protein
VDSNSTPLHSAQNFNFQKVIICLNRTSNEIVILILLWCCNLSRNFKTCNTECFRHNYLHESSNSLILAALEWKLDGAFEHIFFFIRTPLNNCTKLMKTTTSIGGSGEVDGLSCNSFGMTVLRSINYFGCWELFDCFVSRVLPAFKDTNKKHKIYAIIKLGLVQEDG